MGVFNSKIFTVLVSVFLVWMLFSVILIKFKKDGVTKEIKSVESKIEDVKKNNQILERLVNNFDNPAFLEREARLRLNYKGQGEEVVFVYRDSTVNIASPSERFSFKKLIDYKEWLYGLFK